MNLEKMMELRAKIVADPDRFDIQALHCCYVGYTIGAEETIRAISGRESAASLARDILGLTDQQAAELFHMRVGPHIGLPGYIFLHRPINVTDGRSAIAYLDYFIDKYRDEVKPPVESQPEPQLEIPKSEPQPQPEEDLIAV